MASRGCGSHSLMSSDSARCTRFILPPCTLGLSAGRLNIAERELFIKTFRLLSIALFHSFISALYIAPLQETYSEALSIQLRSKRDVLRSLQKEDTLS